MSFSNEFHRSINIPVKIHYIFRSHQQLWRPHLCFDELMSFIWESNQQAAEKYGFIFYFKWNAHKWWQNASPKRYTHCRYICKYSSFLMKKPKIWKRRTRSTQWHTVQTTYKQFYPQCSRDIINFYLFTQVFALPVHIVIW